MSKVSKRKHVERELRETHLLPDASIGREVVKVVAGRGNNLHEVQTGSGESFLVSMPTKYRKNIWIKRGDFVLIEPITEGERVRGEILTVLFREHVDYIKSEKLWPPAFDDDSAANRHTQEYNIPAEFMPPEDSESGSEEASDEDEESGAEEAQTEGANGRAAANNA